MDVDTVASTESMDVDTTNVEYKPGRSCCSYVVHNLFACSS